MRVPPYLPDDCRAEFRKIARQLIALEIYGDMDADALARYVMAHSYYLSATEYTARAFQRGDIEMVEEWSKVQDRYFKQATACARDLGLTISSRCRLVIPQTESSGDDPDRDMFGD